MYLWLEKDSHHKRTDMKISIVGTGKIADEVMQMLHKDFAGKIEVTGVFARPQSEEKARELCKRTGHPDAVVYTDYEQMLQECPADMVYIANANHVHYQYALRALETKHHTIVEKPITTSRVEIEMLYDAAIQWGVFCLPAFSLLYMPLYEKIYEILPQLGPVHMVQANYAQYSSRYDRYLKGDIAPVFDPEQAGGALMDLNIYNLCFVIGLFGQPRTMHYLANRGYNGVDVSGTLALHYPGFVATLSAAKDCDGHNFGCIQGEKGYIEIEGSVSVMARMKLCLRGQEPVIYEAEAGRHRLSYEFEQFRRIIDNPGECRINIPLVSRVAQIISMSLERMNALT